MPRSIFPSSPPCLPSLVKPQRPRGGGGRALRAQNPGRQGPQAPGALGLFGGGGAKGPTAAKRRRPPEAAGVSYRRWTVPPKTPRPYIPPVQPHKKAPGKSPGPRKGNPFQRNTSPRAQPLLGVSQIAAQGVVNAAVPVDLGPAVGHAQQGGPGAGG